MRFEYKVVPAPTKGIKAKGVKTAPDRFANAMQAVLNEQGAEGWEYLRTDTLPCEEREGLMGKTTVYQNMLVFCRLADMDDDLEDEDVTLLPAPEEPQDAPGVEPVVTPVVATAAAAGTEGIAEEDSNADANETEADDEDQSKSD